MSTPEWSLAEDLQPSSHRAEKAWENRVGKPMTMVWEIEVFSDGSGGGKVTRIGTVVLRGTWGGVSPVTGVLR